MSLQEIRLKQKKWAVYLIFDHETKDRKGKGSLEVIQQTTVY